MQKLSDSESWCLCPSLGEIEKKMVSGVHLGRAMTAQYARNDDALLKIVVLSAGAAKRLLLPSWNMDQVFQHNQCSSLQQ